MRKYLLPLLLIFISKFTLAKELSLETVWSTVAKQSKSQNAAKHELAAASLSRKRASLHWLPHVNLDAKSYYTNDPGLNFLGLLSQRAVTTNDFQPEAINYPHNHLFNSGQLEVNLPLYEGGMKIAELEKETHLLYSKKKYLNKVIIEQYSEIAYLYGALTVLFSQKTELTTFKQQLIKLIHDYQAGSPSSPFGHAGLLSMKSLETQIQALILDNDAKIKAIQNTLSQLGLSESNWEPKKTSLDKYIIKYFPPSTAGDSNNTKIQKELAIAAEHQIAIEKAKYRPTIGAYAEEIIFNGQRNTATAFSTGLYLHWSLFNPSDYALAREATNQALASRYHAADIAERERAESLSIRSSLKGVEQNLILTQTNRELISKLNTIAIQQFNKGSINATQLCDSLSKNLDCIKNEKDLQLLLLMLHKERALKTHFHIPINM